MARKKFITHTEATTSIDILGNAGTATKLKNYVQINGLSFNGSVGLIADPLIEQDLSTNATRYLSFVDSTTATYQRLNVDDTLNYNPSTGALSATIFRGTLDGTAILASKLSSPRTISLSGDVTGSVNFDGSSNVNITATVADDSHNHIISNVDGLQEALNTKLNKDELPSSPNPIIISGQIGTAVEGPTAPLVLPFNEFWVNQGEITYNTSTKRFTVPVAGVYRITFNPFFASGVGSSRVLIGINTDTPTTSSHKGHCYRESATYDTGCLNSIVNLNKNDYIVFYLQSGRLYNQVGDRFNQFTIEKIA